MNRTTLVLVSLLAASACVEDVPPAFRPPVHRETDESALPELTSGGAENTFNHSNDPAGVPPGVPFEPADPAAVRAAGPPELTSRLHSCGKLSVSAVGDLLRSRGLTGAGARPDRMRSAKAIFDARETAAALGAANYDGRVPEAPFASTAAMSKAFDIFAMAAYDAVAPEWAPPACPGVKLFGPDGGFDRDGISCLIGRPATAEHVALANDAMTKNPVDGAKIAVAAMLAAAYTCQ